MANYPTLYLPNEGVESILKEMWKLNSMDDGIYDCCYPAWWSQD